MRQFRVRPPGWRFFTTEDGNGGLGPWGIQSFDHICAVLGCGQLLVLRPRKGDKDHFLVVGNWNLLGFMHLQALLGALLNGWRFSESSDWGQTEEMYFVEQGSKIRTRADLCLDDESHPGWQNILNGDDGPNSWKNNDTGEESRQDPRHSDVQFLKNKGADIKDIYLI